MMHLVRETLKHLLKGCQVFLSIILNIFFMTRKPFRYKGSRRASPGDKADILKKPSYQGARFCHISREGLEVARGVRERSETVQGIQLYKGIEH